MYNVHCSVYMQKFLLYKQWHHYCVTVQHHPLIVNTSVLFRYENIYKWFPGKFNVSSSQKIPNF